MKNTIVIFLTLCILKQNYGGENTNQDNLVYKALLPPSKTNETNDTSSENSDTKVDENDNFKFVEEINSNAYFKLNTAAEIRNESSENYLYPHFSVKMPLGEIIEKYKHIEDRDALLDIEVSVAGRVRDIKRSGEQVVLYYVKSDGFEIQVVSASNAYKSFEEFKSVANKIKRGDIIGCVGHPDKDDHRQLVVVAKSIRLLSPCLYEIPDLASGFTNQEDRFRKRYLDLILNDKTRQIFYTRARIIAYIRQYLDKLGFLEIETPILNMVPGGATANPFVTHLDELNMDLFLRISPELYHKMLVVGGFNRVYEIGRQFRRDTLDSTHNPEFTSCEFYMAYADYNDLIIMTENLLSGMVKSIHGSYKIKYHPNGPLGEELEIDFTPPFARVSLMDALERALNVSLPPADQLETPEANAFLSDLCDQHEIKVWPRTTFRLLDNLVEKFVEEKCVNPTFIMDYPRILSPYVRSHKFVPGLTERFELFVSKKEVCNAYSELSDPAEQRRRWLQQATERAAGDTEVPPSWPTYLTALQVGLPPTAGWGGGVDRLAMLLTDSHTIQEVILFPPGRPEDINSIGEDQATVFVNKTLSTSSP